MYFLKLNSINDHLGLQDLQRNLALVPQVIRQVDRGHAAFTQLALDRVAAEQGCVQSSGGVGHPSYCLGGPQS